MQTKDMTVRAREAWEYYDAMLDDRIRQISERSQVPPEHFKKINPAEFIEKSRFQIINGYTYQRIDKWIQTNKTDDQTFLISPLDAIEETANQVSYKSAEKITRTIRASKCEVQPCAAEMALDFFIRNHRQSAPHIGKASVSYCLVYGPEIVAVMLYDISDGAVRGNKGKQYELVRLSISSGTKIHGGASKLQQACEQTMLDMGVRKIYSYSNSTINSGAVYEKLGFQLKQIDGGQPFVIMENFDLVRLVNLHPHSTDRELAKAGRLKTHVGGNKLWIKTITGKGADSD